MADDSLTLTVQLDDQASQRLANLKQQLDNLDRGSSGGFFGRMGRESEGATRGIKSLHSELGLMAGRAGFIGGVVGGITSELVKLGAETVKDISNIQKLSMEMQTLSNSAYRMGTSTAQLESGVSGLRRIGIQAAEAIPLLERLSDTVADLSLINSQIRPQLLSGGFLPFERMAPLLQRLDEAKTMNDRVKALRDASLAVREFNEQFGPEVAARQQRRFEAVINLPGISKWKTTIEEAGKAEDRLAKQRDAANEKFIAHNARLKDGYDDIVKSGGSILINLSNTVNEGDNLAKSLETVVRWMKQLEESDTAGWLGRHAADLAGAVPGAAASLIPGVAHIRGSLEFYRMLGRGNVGTPPDALGNAMPLPFGGGWGGGGEARGGWGGNKFWREGRTDVDVEDRRDLEDNTEQTKSLTDQIKNLNEMLLTPPPGSLAAQLGLGSLSGGAGGGGGGGGGGAGGSPGYRMYSPDGGVAPPSSGTPGDGTVPRGGGGGGGGGQTRGDRNNNPGNLKMGPHAMAFGAVAADDKGFAIFPNRESGEAAQQTLVASDRYKGLTLQQFANKYAEGSRDWMATVGKEMGLKPGDIVPNQDPRLPGAIQKAEGTLPKVGGGDAREVIPGAGSGGRYNYMQSQGRPPLERNQLATIDTPYGKLAVHPDAAADFTGFYKDLSEAGAPIGKVGTYNKRMKRWGGGWSSHAYGTAHDLEDQVQISPAMRKWIQENPERWAAIKRRYNMGQPLADESGVRGKDPAHIEWKGPIGTRYARPGEMPDGTIPMPRPRPDAASLDGRNLDKAAAGERVITGKGTLEVTINGPPGVRASASGEGLLKDTRVEQETQMIPASKGYDPD